MGACGSNNVQLNYSIPYGPANPGETEVRRNPQAVQGLISKIDNETATLQDSFLRAAKLYGDKNCLGSFQGTGYKFKTYAQILEIAESLGSGLENLGLVKSINEYKNFNLKMVGIFSKNREEWIQLDIANILYGYTMIPFYDTLGADSIPFILEQTKLETMFLSADALKTIFQITNKHSLKNLVLLDPIPEDQKQHLSKLDYRHFTFQEIIEKGKSNIRPRASVGTDSVFTFSYTSGTTGNPKGAMLSHGNFIATISAVSYTDIKLSCDDVHISYLPLPHVMERLITLSLLHAGASIGYYRGDPLLLKEDIQLLRPTLFISVPRLYNKFYDGIKSKIAEVTGLKRSFADRALRIKLENLHQKAEYHDSLYDKAFQGVRDLFGGRCRFMLTGSAPISSEVIDFLKVTAGCPIYEGYGSTESTGGSFVTSALDPNSGQVGGPTTATEFKLVDVPEMNYTSQDIVNGRKAARGEICLRGPGIFLGYYKDEEKTREAIDQEGWLHIGDIGMLTETGGLKIIDRKKNIFKLQQGEYIAPEKLEGVYNRAPGVAESFVYGDSLQNYCVAVIVPHQPFVEKLASENNLQGSFEELCKNPQIISIYQKNIATFGKANKLNSLEIAKVIYLEPQSLGVYGCLTTTFKLQRYKAKEVFKKQIEDMYKAGGVL